MQLCTIAGNCPPWRSLPALAGGSGVRNRERYAGTLFSRRGCHIGLGEGGAWRQGAFVSCFEIAADEQREAIHTTFPNLPPSHLEPEEGNGPMARAVALLWGPDTEQWNRHSLGALSAK